jgi:D-psicose/D-tagatose/L-ribulose 3-epimerase
MTVAGPDTSPKACASALKFALCNEVLQGLDFKRQCEVASALGYDGLEIAPFTLAGNPMDISDVKAMMFRRIAEDQGLKVFGLHWLLVAPTGLSMVEKDPAVRARTAAVMERMVELCSLMGGSYLVHGSPKQRSVPADATRVEAWERARECLRLAGARAERCGVVYCIEPLSPQETDLINTVADAVVMLGEIGCPALKTMIDCSAAGVSESVPVAALMEQWMPTGLIGHVQVNDPNRRGPGQGAMAFAPILKVLQRMCADGHYAGTVGVEPFDYVPDGMGSAARAIGYLKGLTEGLNGNG